MYHLLAKYIRDGLDFETMQGITLSVVERILLTKKEILKIQDNFLALTAHASSN